MKRELSTPAKTAKAIRSDLKQAFPQTTFRVISESYAGGSAVRISWVDGPTSQQVNTIVRQYEYGHFNGMEDIYEYSNTRDDIPQVKFVQTSRGIDEVTMDQAFHLLKEEHGELQGCETLQDKLQYPGAYYHTAFEFVRSILSKHDITRGLTALSA